MGFWLGLVLILAGCAAQPKPLPAIPQLSQIKRTILELARREWDFFGRQVVVLNSDGESIPQVGHWEDDAETYAYRINGYWQAVGKPDVTGWDCQEPWSAAFISWVMREARVSEYQFPPAYAHWLYLTQIIAGTERRGFIPRTLDRYTPQPGDLICATRGVWPTILASHDTIDAALIENAPLHCDIVVEREANTLGLIGGNVRNSVSKTMVQLDAQGLVRPSKRRPWFMVLENRL